MANKEIWIVLKVVDQATEGIKKVGWELSWFAKKSEDAFKKMSVWWWVAFASISAFALKWLRSYQEVERAGRQLERTIIDVSKGTAEQVKEVKALTLALEKKSGVDAEALNQWIAQLSTFWLQTKSVVDLTKSLADLTVNQNGVNASADQYISSANVMAKALRWEFGMLTKMGIRFTETQQNMINFGTESEKVTALQEWLAQNLRETTDTVWWLDVSMAKFQRNTEAIWDAVGQAIAPALNSLRETVIPLIERFTAWAEKNPELLGNIILLAWWIAWLVTVLWWLWLAIPSIVAWIWAVSTALWVVKLAFIAVWWPITILIALMAVLVTMVISNRDQIKQWFLDGVEAIKILIWALWTYLQTLWMTILSNIRQFMDNFLQFWRDWRNAVVDFVMGKVNGMVERLSGALERVLWVVRSIKNAFDSAKSMVWDGVSAVTNFVTGQRQFGWTVQAGKSYLVWERWPEIITPASTSKVQTDMWGGMSISINMGWVTVNNDADENRLVQKITDALTRQTQLYQFGIN